MNKDIWHFPRTSLAKQVLGMFEIGLSSALIFFAPRRMGKTEFLIKDMQPLAESEGWSAFYFSFLDVEKSAQEEFTIALARFAEKVGVDTRSLAIFKKIKKITGGIAGIEAGIELRNPDDVKSSMKETLEKLSKKKKVLLLLDEVQVLAKHEHNEPFVAGLRTALDMFKDSIKVIFTGSSREGLRRMFSQANASFFHFGQNLPFPELDREFIDHLAAQFRYVTKRQLNNDQLWDIFLEMDKVPQLIRSLVERIVLNPELDLHEAKDHLLADVFNDRAFAETWDDCTMLERLLLIQIASGIGGLFSQETRDEFSKKIGVSMISTSAIQSSLRVLLRKLIVGRLSGRGDYYIEDPNFKSWLLQEK